VCLSFALLFSINLLNQRDLLMKNDGDDDEDGAIPDVIHRSRCDQHVRSSSPSPTQITATETRATGDVWDRGSLSCLMMLFDV